MIWTGQFTWSEETKIHIISTVILTLGPVPLMSILKRLDCRNTFINCCLNRFFFLSLADINEERGCNPQHLIHLGLRYAEARIDYMGTCILMGNLSAFKTDLRDEWKLQETTSPSTGEV